MFDAIIILLTCASQDPASCVPFFAHQQEIEKPEDCEDIVLPMVEAFAAKAPKGVYIRGTCSIDPEKKLGI